MMLALLSHLFLLLSISVAILSATIISAWSPSRLHPSMHRHSHPVASLQGAFHRRFMASNDVDDEEDAQQETSAKHSGYNVLGTELSCCCSNVGGSGIGTGFYRNGFCSTGDMDLGRHTVCVQVTDAFLQYSKSVGNDLSTPMPQYNFPGLKDGDIWCLCAQRWAQAYNAGKAPRLLLKSTHEKTLDYVPLEVLKVFALDMEEANAVENELNAQRSQLNALFNKGVEEDNESFQ
mmetsp:Transcript_15049/g.30615  ORF Transcript_15049/g.30615 Transcript_15049/m.30615 type:complete len:234 (-) Transcript_15049:132-833(-)